MEDLKLRTVLKEDDGANRGDARSHTLTDSSASPEVNQTPPRPDEAEAVSTDADSPSAEMVMAALRRCTQMAAERRRELEEEDKELRKKRGAKRTDPAVVSPRTPRRSVQHRSAPRRAPQASRTLTTYCSELLDELTNLNRTAFGPGLPSHTHRLVVQEIQRIESQLSVADERRYLVPLREALNNVPILDTVGRPPLRVPSSMLHRNEKQSGDEEAVKVEEESELEEGELKPESNSNAAAEAKPLEVVAEVKEEEETDSDESSIEVILTKKTPQKEPKKENDEKKEESKEADKPKSAKRRSKKTKKSRPLPSTWRPLPSLWAKPIPTPTTPTSLMRRVPLRSALRPNAPTSSKNVPPILEAPEPPPLKIQFNDGVPNDIGFYRLQPAYVHPMAALSAKIYIPELNGYSFIGRILGPRGLSVRRLEAETGCKILIRGRGSVKDPQRERELMKEDGYEHLKDKLHVLIATFDETREMCRRRLDFAIETVKRLLIPQYDEYKRQQLMQLAMINGTYRP